ncbi:MAG: hypothetical protein V7724_00925 [Sediminicola sp.]
MGLHDETHFGGKELSGTALFVHGLAYGANNGILEREKYCIKTDFRAASNPL